MSFRSLLLRSATFLTIASASTLAWSAPADRSRGRQSNAAAAGSTLGASSGRTEAEVVEAERYFSELFTQDGYVREHYKAILTIYKNMTPAQREAFVKESKKLFRGDNALHPLPRILTTGEYDVLNRGVQQRGTAIRIFLQDHYSGRKLYAERGVIPKQVVDRIIERAGEHFYAGHVKPEHISAIYGPDIVRGSDGQFYVIEDNLGYVGGLGDLKIAREALLQLQRNYRTVINPVGTPDEFYRTLVDRWKARANPRGGKVVMFQIPPYPDNEDFRLSKIMAELGVETITPYTDARLEAASDGSMVIRRYVKKGVVTAEEPVGFVVLNGEHRWMDISHPATRRAFLIDEAKSILEESRSQKAKERIQEALKPDPATGEINEKKLISACEQSDVVFEYSRTLKNSPKGLMKAIFEGKVASNYSPGVDFVGDKEFYTYVEDLIRFYLNEEPILKNLPTRRFGKWVNGKVELVRELFDEIFTRMGLNKGVVKTVDGRGGDGVLIGKKAKPEEIASYQKRVQQEPDRFIVQDYMPLSRVEGEPQVHHAHANTMPPAAVDAMIVDLRLISDLAPDSVYVSPVPWGRGISVDGDGKVNLSASGREFTVIVVPEPGRSCLERRLGP